MVFVGTMANRFSDFNTEIDNLGLLTALTDKHGAAAGRAIFDELKWVIDPDAPTTVPESAGRYTVPVSTAGTIAYTLPDYRDTPPSLARLARHIDGALLGGPKLAFLRHFVLWLGLLSGAIAGAGLGFLWFNAYPAEVFMGDVGALALGAAMGTIAVIVRQEIVLFIMGGLFVAEALSVMVQVLYFKYTGGKRIFRMAPLHHHYELGGWKETQVVVRFWIICGLCVALGMGIFYAEWVVGQ